MDNKNLLLAVVISFFILVGYDMMMGLLRKDAPPPVAPAVTESPAAVPSQPAAPLPMAPTPGQASAPASVPGQVPAVEMADRKAMLANAPRVRITSPRLHGSISLVGGLFDDITFADYHETIDKSSPEIVLLTPRGAGDAYYALFGWTAAAGIAVPGPETPWKADRDVLEPGKPLTLTWSNGQGLEFQRTIALDDDYMFTVTETVANKGGAVATLHPFGLVSRRGTPPVSGYYILHEGPLGVFDGKLAEVTYADLQEKATVEHPTTGGWIGITDKYWLVALVPDQKLPVGTRFLHRRDDGADKYQVDYLGAATTVAPGASTTVSTHFFAGAKKVTLLDAYAEKLGVQRFDLAIDFGWFYFLTKPIFYGLIYLNAHVGNFGIAILLLTVCIKLLMFPLANKSYRAMSKMKLVQPEMIKLRERFGEDKVRLNQEMMALYKREKVNPASGCLPILVQIPVFFALYKVLFVTIEMRQAPFYGWIHDLSAPDPTTIFNLFGLIPWTPPQFLMIGIWPLVMGVTMYLQQKLNPQPPDPVQAKVFAFLPFLFTFLLASFPAGLVIYWAWNNMLSILQQWVIMRGAETRKS